MVEHEYFSVLSHRTGTWYHFKNVHPGQRAADDCARKFSKEHPEGKYDVIRLFGSLLEEYNKGLSPEQHVLIPRQEVVASYGPIKEEHLSNYHLICSSCGNEKADLFMKAMVQGGILCNACGHAKVVKQIKEIRS